VAHLLLAIISVGDAGRESKVSAVLLYINYFKIIIILAVE